MHCLFASVTLSNKQTLLFIKFLESINKPGGCAKIVKVHTNRVSDNLADDEDSYVEGLDVKYTVGGGGENNLDPAIVSPYEELQRRGRSRRGREFLMQGTNANSNTKPGGNRRGGKENVKEATANKSAAKTNKAKIPVLENKKQAQKKKNKAHSSQKSGATCSTPPPPKHATRKQPKKVTPIPKVVLVNSMKAANDVSPMWMDAASSSNSNHTNNNPIHKAQHRLDFDEEVPSLPNSLHPPNKPMQSKAKSHKSTHDTNKRKRPPTATTNDTAVSRNKHGNRPVGPTTKFSNSKPNTQPKLSFSRATSAYGSLPQSNSTKKKNLLDVYRSEVEKAHQFMDEMVSGPRATGKDSDKPKATLSKTPQKS